MPFGPKEVGYVYAYVGILGVILQGGLIGRCRRHSATGSWYGRAGYLRGFFRGAGLDVRHHATC